MLTGESMPVEKQPGDTVTGATINKNDSLVMEARKVGADTFSNVDMALTQNAQAKTRLFRSGSIYLISLLDLVAAVGFEPTTFRL